MPLTLNNYAEAQAKERLTGTEDIDTSKEVGVSFHKYEYFYVHIICGFRNKNNSVAHQEFIKYGGIKGIVFTVKKILIHSFKDNAFSEELLPYLLFCFAFTAPIWSKVI